MNLRLALYVTFLLLGRLTAMAQIPVQKVKDPAATEAAGIGSYHLTQEQGGLSLPGEVGPVGVEAFDVAGQSLASCEIEWLEDSKAMTCTMSDGERFQVTWYQDRAEVADRLSGDHFSLSKEGSPAIEDSHSDSEKSLLEREGWVGRGTKSWEEVERDWSHITPVFGYLLAEVEITLGMIPGDRMFLDRRIYLSKETSRLGLPSKFDLCNGGPSFCDSNDVCMISQVFASTSTACCAKASRQADTCCRSFTLVDCCANTLCNAILPSGLVLRVLSRWFEEEMRLSMPLKTLRSRQEKDWLTRPLDHDSNT